MRPSILGRDASGELIPLASTPAENHFADAASVPFNQSRIKRCFDIIVSLSMIIVFLPLLVMTAALLWWTDGAPLTFGHERVGKDGRPFKCLKFRTMVRDSQEVLTELLQADPAAREKWETCFKLDNDPRIIPGIGNFLRRTSLDELPQLLNVLRGDMSIVGPRPVTREELGKYGPYCDHYKAVKPGLTGPWQIGGRSTVAYEARVSLDVWYVENACLRTDLSILLSTTTGFVTGRLDGAQ